MRLQAEGAVITGAGSGVGLAMATRFAAEGARVVAGDRNAAPARCVARVRADRAPADPNPAGEARKEQHGWRTT